MQVYNAATAVPFEALLLHLQAFIMEEEKFWWLQGSFSRQHSLFFWLVAAPIQALVPQTHTNQDRKISSSKLFWISHYSSHSDLDRERMMLYSKFTGVTYGPPLSEWNGVLKSEI